MIELSYEELKAKLEELQKNVPATNCGGPEFKVSEKGAVSMYGLGRFPVTLYYEQWLKLLDRVERLRGFLEANKNTVKLRSRRPDGC
jgi:hypothetical protein